MPKKALIDLIFVLFENVHRLGRVLMERSAQVHVVLVSLGRNVEKLLLFSLVKVQLFVQFVDFDIESQA